MFALAFRFLTWEIYEANHHFQRYYILIPSRSVKQLSTDPTRRNANFEDGYGIEQPLDRRCLPSVCITGNRRVICVALVAVGINDSRPLKLHVRVQANLSLFGTEAPSQSIHRFSETRTVLREKRHERIIKSGLVLSTVLGGMWDAAWFRYEGIIRRNATATRSPLLFSFFLLFRFGESRARFPPGFRLSRTNVSAHSSQANWNGDDERRRKFRGDYTSLFSFARSSQESIWLGNIPKCESPKLVAFLMRFGVNVIFKKIFDLYSFFMVDVETGVKILPQIRWYGTYFDYISEIIE